MSVFAIAPRFATTALTKVAGKCFDYSLFRAGKEMLYIPLGYAEKTRGKALVDIMTYRVAKGFASLLAIGLTLLDMLPLVTTLCLFCVGLWFIITWRVTRRYHQRLETLPQG